MIRQALVLTCLVWCACAADPTSPPVGALMEGTGDIGGVSGLERLDGTGPYVAGATERFRLHVDTAQVARVEWSASGGSLSTSGHAAEWELPSATTAELSVRVVRRDGTNGTVTWQFAMMPRVDANRPMTAQAALLATPMPVLDGGTLEVSGGACKVRYEGTTSNVAIAFTTATHPSLMFGRWNGSTWALEVVDALGFNTGGLILQHVVMQLEANGTPHLVYVRDSNVMYATKVGGVWTRERVDTSFIHAGPLLSTSTREATAPSIALNGSTPSILYVSGAGNVPNPFRPVIATRTGPNTWSSARVSGVNSGGGTVASVFSWSDLVIDGSGRHLFVVSDGTASSGSGTQLVAWTPALRESVVITAQSLDTRFDLTLAGANRLLIRTATGVWDAALAATFTNTTMAFSRIEVNGAGVGAIAWSPSQSRPFVLHHHGTTLELATTNAASFWSFQQLGTSTMDSAGLTVHPTTGDVSLCYSANNRIMFQ